jgi:hypothetical protein
VSVEETEFSRWFAQRQPAHVHQWGWCGTTMTYYPLTVARACGGQHPIWLVPPERQRQFVEHASASQIETFYAGLASPDRAFQQRSIEMVFDSVNGSER